MKFRSCNAVRHTPHELRSFGHGCRHIGPKPSVPLYEQAPKRQPDFRPCMARSFRGNGVNLV